MNVFFKPILHDKNVLALMFLMVIFAQEEAEYDQGGQNAVPALDLTQKTPDKY